MAYNKAFNPDALPAFAEPERKNNSSVPAPLAVQKPKPQGQPTPPPQQQQYSNTNRPPPPSKQPVQSGPPPNHSHQGGYSQPQHQQQHGGSKPQPPLPSRTLSPQTQPPATNYAYSASPPNSYGFQSPPPPVNYGNRPPSGQSRPAASPSPRLSPGHSPGTPAQGAVDPALWPLFKAVDKSGSGQLTERELGAALVNGDWSPFDPLTVQMMIRMFDTDRSGAIGFDEFCGLWGFLAAWRGLFDRFDADHSGNISLPEYSHALVAFGYRLSESFVGKMFQVYDKRGDGAISFDMFVQSCISLKRMTDVFKKYDDDRDGFITLSFEDFLLEILRQR